MQKFVTDDDVDCSSCRVRYHKHCISRSSESLNKPFSSSVAINRSASIGAIVGGVVGALVVLAAIIVVVLCMNGTLKSGTCCGAQPAPAHSTTSVQESTGVQLPVASTVKVNQGV